MAIIIEEDDSKALSDWDQVTVTHTGSVGSMTFGGPTLSAGSPLLLAQSKDLEELEKRVAADLTRMAETIINLGERLNRVENIVTDLEAENVVLRRVVQGKQPISTLAVRGTAAKTPASSTYTGALTTYADEIRAAGEQYEAMRKYESLGKGLFGIEETLLGVSPAGKPGKDLSPGLVPPAELKAGSGIIKIV